MRIIEAERATWQQDLHVEEDLDSKLEFIPEQRDDADDEGRSVDQSSSFPYLVINEDDILLAAKKAKRLTAGGLQ